MKLTSKGRYAVMAMADLAKINANKPTSLSEISISLISLNLIKSSLNILFVPITFVISYYLFSTKSKKL